MMVRHGLYLKLAIMIMKYLKKKMEEMNQIIVSVQQVTATTSSILHPYIVKSSGKLTNIIFLNLQYLKFLTLKSKIY